MNAVIDTNVWVSGLLSLSGTPSRILDAYLKRRFTLITSEPMLSELTEVLRRPRISRKYGIKETDITELQRLMRGNAIIVPVLNSVHVCRDPDDDVVLETAVVGKAQVIVSGDSDLIESSDVIEYVDSHQIQLTTAATFLQMLENPEANH